MSETANSNLRVKYYSEYCRFAMRPILNSVKNSSMDPNLRIWMERMISIKFRDIVSAS